MDSATDTPAPSEPISVAGSETEIVDERKNPSELLTEGHQPIGDQDGDAPRRNTVETSDPEPVIVESDTAEPRTAPTNESTAPSSAVKRAPSATKGLDDDDDENEAELQWDVTLEILHREGEPLEDRRKKARKRLLQATSYAVLLEDRVNDLEGRLNALHKLVTKEEQESTHGESTTGNDGKEVKELSNTPAKLTWEEFDGQVGLPVEKLGSIIDLLIQKPKPYQKGHEPGSYRRRRVQQDLGSCGGQKKTCVERIRINSEPLCELMEEVMGNGIAPTSGSTMLRPFKALFVYRDELQKRFGDMKKDMPPDAGSNLADVAEATESQPEVHAMLNRPLDKNNSTGEDPAVEDAPAESEVQEDLGADGLRDQAMINKAPTITTQPLDAASGARVVETTEANGKVSSSDSAGIQTPIEQKASERDQLLEEKERLDQRRKLAHLEALLEMIQCELKEELDTHSRYQRRSPTHIRFDDLWHLFAPGDIIFHPKHTQAYQVLSVHDGREVLSPSTSEDGKKGDESDLLARVDDAVTNPFVLDFFYIQYNGQEFGLSQAHHKIKPFTGEKAIMNLEYYPIQYSRSRGAADQEGHDQTWDMLMKRGAKFKQLADATKVGHCEYKGMTVESVPELVDSQVIIDTSYYYEMHSDEIPSMTLLDPTEGDKREIAERCPCARPSCDSVRRFYDDRKIESERMEYFVRNNVEWLREWSPERSRESFKPEHLILLPHKLWGFVLYSREWHPLDVDKIQFVIHRTQAFDELVLRSEHRILVESQVTMHSTGVKPANDSVGQAENSLREDLVRGKGKGLIILLHGAPGVGKTSTAECVAEYTKRPLLSITCGDIGDNAADVQENLGLYLSLAHRWGCVMLLDEADVFLSTRDKRDMKRNAVVSVFLRILEYYSGILFLTTNKVGTIDEAFKSRIHLSLYYGPLDYHQTTRIWKLNLQRVQHNRPGLQIDETELLMWAARSWDECQRTKVQPWNGRQIRNACQTAAALAEFEKKSRITVTHLNAVANASRDFDRYLSGVHGGDDAWRAKKNQDRRDDFSQYGSSAQDDQYYASSHRDDQYNAPLGRDNGDGRHYEPPASPRRSGEKSVAGGRTSRGNPYSPTHANEEYEPASYPGPRDFITRQTTGDFYDEAQRDRRRESMAMPPPPRPAQRELRDTRSGPRIRTDSRRGARMDSHSNYSEHDSDHERRR